MKNKNIFLSSAIVTVIAWAFSSVISLIFGRAVLNLGINFFKIAVSLCLSFLIYHKIIEKSKMHVGRVIALSLLSALINFGLSLLLININIFFYNRKMVDLVSLLLVVFFAFLKNLTQIKEENSKNNISDSKIKKISKKYYPSFITIAIISYIIYVALFVCVVGFIEAWDIRFSKVIGLIFGGGIFSLFYTYIYFLPYLIANKKEHLQKRAIYILNIFAGWTIVAWIVALIWANTEQKKTVVINQTAPQSNADELKKYKDLLDAGIITQEEFEIKKKQLLNI